jgi:hypothetical protein
MAIKAIANRMCIKPPACRPRKPIAQIRMRITAIGYKISSIT